MLGDGLVVHSRRSGCSRAEAGVQGHRPERNHRLRPSQLHRHSLAGKLLRTAVLVLARVTNPEQFALPVGGPGYTNSDVLRARKSLDEVLLSGTGVAVSHNRGMKS